MRLLTICFKIFLICLLTIITQVGGIVYLLNTTTYKLTDHWTNKKTIKATIRFATFLLLYCFTTFILVPIIANPFGRVPLPITETNHLQPLNVLTCFLNRNYARPELRQTAFDVANQMKAKYPGTIINYLDANFPFIDNFPLLPHLSHDDGKKLDLSFCYRNNITGQPTNECPSFIGYGISADPEANENNTALSCVVKGYWQYGLLNKIIPQGKKKNFTLDNDKTRELVSEFASQSAIGKIFIEPHLKKRFNLTSEKIRFHGCQAVRHDDHIHLELE